ncbi:hypothetical protein [Gallibacterium anatis]|uniref:hypothetical protein n=1 Tax=Gallibacterium anatis TaxID=750 RepID=UPI0039FCA4CA
MELELLLTDKEDREAVRETIAKYIGDMTNKGNTEMRAEFTHFFAQQLKKVVKKETDVTALSLLSTAVIATHAIAMMMGLDHTDFVNLVDIITEGLQEEGE